MPHLPLEDAARGDIRPLVPASFYVSLLWLLVIALPFALNLSPIAASAMEYDRTAVTEGQLWRLLFGGFAHINLSHASLNTYSTVLLVVLFGAYRHAGTLISYLVLCVSVFALEHLVGDNSWARGTSGALYGFAVFGALHYLNRLGCVLVLSAVALKMSLDLAGVTPDTSEMLGAPILTSHHLYGVSAGVFLWCCLRLLTTVKTGASLVRWGRGFWPAAMPR